MQAVNRLIVSPNIVLKDFFMNSVSVVIPCYNAESYLRETIQSVLKQTHPVLEVIVVDDGSTDGSREIAESFNSPVRVIAQPNQGESVARNHGLEEARGTWTALLDADDVWDATKIKRQLDAIANTREAENPVVCVYCDFYRFNTYKRYGAVVTPELPGADLISGLLNVSANCSTAMVRTDIARGVGFPIETRSSEDMIFFAELRSHGRFLRVGEALTGYRISDGQQTSQSIHFIKSAESRFDWAKKRTDLFSPDDLKRLVAGMATGIRWRMKEAVGKGDKEAVERSLECLAKLNCDSHEDHSATQDALRSWYYYFYFKMYRFTERNLASLFARIRNQREI